jgi:hypothetical protein
MLLVLPKPKLGCVLLLIVRTSSPTIAKPHVSGSKVLCCLHFKFSFVLIILLNLCKNYCLDLLQKNEVE